MGDSGFLDVESEKGATLNVGQGAHVHHRRRPVGGEGGRWHSHHIQHAMVHRQTSDGLSSIPPGLTGSCLALPGHHNPSGPFRSITGGCVVELSSWWFSPYPRWSRSPAFLWWKAFLAPLMNRFHIALWCSWSLEGSACSLGHQKGLLCGSPAPLCAVGWGAHIC